MFPSECSNSYNSKIFPAESKQNEFVLLIRTHLSSAILKGHMIKPTYQRLTQPAGWSRSAEASYHLMQTMQAS